MPLYEYQCQSCQKVHEVIQKLSDALLENCPDCQGQVSKLMSLGSFALKGSGWYTTDYKRAGAAPSPVSAPSPAAPATAPKAKDSSS